MFQRAEISECSNQRGSSVDDDTYIENPGMRRVVCSQFTDSLTHVTVAGIETRTQDDDRKIDERDHQSDSERKHLKAFHILCCARPPNASATLSEVEGFAAPTGLGSFSIRIEKVSDQHSP